MKLVLKRVIMALALLFACIFILGATKSYGVWVISAIAVALFLLGVLRKGEHTDGTGQPDAKKTESVEDVNESREAR